MIKLRKNYARKKVKVGYSWTIAFFGFFVPLFRGDIKFAIILFLATTLSEALLPVLGPIIVGIIFVVNYNNWYLQDLLADGWQIYDTDCF